LNTHAKFNQDVLVRRHSREAQREAWFSLSQTQRRLAHRLKRDAIEAEQAGNHARYSYCRTESNRLWREAKTHLYFARTWG
jgi:hypothetical protein